MTLTVPLTIERSYSFSIFSLTCSALNGFFSSGLTSRIAMQTFLPLLKAFLNSSLCPSCKGCHLPIKKAYCSSFGSSDDFTWVILPHFGSFGLLLVLSSVNIGLWLIGRCSNVVLLFLLVFQNRKRGFFLCLLG